MNTTLKGDLFEERAREILINAINEGQLGIISTSCKIFSKHAYYSKDRAADITFDLSIEVRPPNAKEMHLLYLVECKDYSNRKVEIGDVEILASKLDQIEGSKGIMVVSSELQKSALEFARSKRIMVIEVNPSGHANTVMHNKKRNNKLLTDVYVNEFSHHVDALRKIGKFYEEVRFNLDWDNLIKNFLTQQLNIQLYWDQPGCKSVGLEYLSLQLIEQMTIDILNDFDTSILYKHKALSIERFMDYMHEKYSLTYITDQELPIVKGRKLNGYCDIEKKCIYIDKSLNETSQFSFICAHETGHFFLHSKLKIPQVKYDNLNDSAYDPAIGKHLLLNEKHWIEWQANQFAAALVMPHKSILGKLITWQTKEGIRNKGTVYVDNQPYNVRDFKVMITLLAYEFKVSRTILEYRMADLKIITYAKAKGYNSYSLFGYSKPAKSIGTIIRRLPYLSKSFFE